MRLIEIAPGPTPEQFAISPKFASNYEVFSRRWPALPAQLLNFCNNKKQGFSPASDRGRFEGPLKDYWHAHLKVGPGKGDLIVVIYATKGNTLRLYELVPHKYYEGSNKPRLKKWLDSIPNDSFIVIDPDEVFSNKSEVEPEEPLSDDERKKVMDEIYYLISDEAFETLRAALIGNDWGELLRWLVDIVNDEHSGPEPITTNDILSAFDGQDGLKDIIHKGLVTYGKLDNFKEFLGQ